MVAAKNELHDPSAIWFLFLYDTLKRIRSEGYLKEIIQNCTLWRDDCFLIIRYCDKTV